MKAPFAYIGYYYNKSDMVRKEAWACILLERRAKREEDPLDCLLEDDCLQDGALRANKERNLTINIANQHLICYDLVA